MVSPEDAVPFSSIDLSSLKEEERSAVIQSTSNELQASLNLSEGPLVRVVLFETGSQKPGNLLIIIHHLAIDGVSWRILLEQLDLLYQQLSRNEDVHLPPKTTSYKYWAQRLNEYAQSDDLRQGFSYWLTLMDVQHVRLPLNYPQGRDKNTELSADTITVSLNAKDTQALLKEVPKAYQTQINDVLLTALAQALYQWTKKSIYLIDLKGHGREALFEDIDLLRTVGWFTTVFPVTMSLEGAPELGELLKSIKEQLRRIPNRGIGYGLLRYFCDDPDIVKLLQSLPQAELSFDYLGQFDQILPHSSPFKLLDDSYGQMRSSRGKRKYLVEIEGGIIGDQLHLRWKYSKNIHKNSTIENLAQGFMEALSKLIDHCLAPTAGGYTPSDFPEADLSQEELDELLAQISELE
jgi:non-ribosomal peptide synthase protein (TIGR01720 family)